MTYSIEELEPLETRKARHSHHFIDNMYPDAKVRLLKGKKNTFIYEENGGSARIGPIFEERFDEPLEDLIKFVQDRAVAVNLAGFPPSVLEDHFFTVTGYDPVKSWKLYQTPLSVEAYDKKLKRFRKSGFSYRKLEKDDIPALQGLISGWAKEKTRRAIPEEFKMGMSNIRDIDNIMERLSNIRSEIAYLDFTKKDKEDYEKFMDQPLTALYGCFRDGELLAYIHTEGNDSHQAFHTRAAVRMNSFSPQEFLDYSIAREFSSRGVPRFDRGFLNVREGMIGLVEYKRKFGPIHGVIEQSLNSIYLRNSPEYRYLQENIDWTE